MYFYSWLLMFRSYILGPFSGFKYENSIFLLVCNVTCSVIDHAKSKLDRNSAVEWSAFKFRRSRVQTSVRRSITLNKVRRGLLQSL